MRNLQEQVKKAFCYQKLFWPVAVWMNCSSDLKKFANSRPSSSNLQSFSRSIEFFFLTVGQNNFGNKIQFFHLQVDTRHVQDHGIIRWMTPMKKWQQAAQCTDQRCIEQASTRTVWWPPRPRRPQLKPWCWSSSVPWSPVARPLLWMVRKIRGHSYIT